MHKKTTHNNVKTGVLREMQIPKLDKLFSDSGKQFTHIVL